MCVQALFTSGAFLLFVYYPFSTLNCIKFFMHYNKLGVGYARTHPAPTLYLYYTSMYIKLSWIWV